MRTVKFLLALLLVLFVTTPVVKGKIIYFDNFDGPAGTDLNMTRPDVTPSGETWAAGQYIDADGTLGGGNSGNMFTAVLPFVPAAGNIYELSAVVDNQGDWVGIGFLSAATNLETRILDNGPVLWALARQSGTGAKDQAFVGPGTAGALGDAPTSSAGELKVRVDTRNETQWIVTWFFDGTLGFQRTVDPSTLNIQYVAFGSNGLFSAVSGKITSFLLEEISQNTKAHNPDPADKSISIPIETTLSWNAGIFADKHDIYLSSDLDALNNATNSNPMGPDQIYLARQDLDANSIVVTDLIPDTIYYWRVDEVNDANPAKLWPGDVWTFTTVPLTAIDPDPVDGAIFVDPDIILSWTPGPYAATQDVYIGTNFNDINDATRADHAGVTYYSENQEASIYPEEGTLDLELGQTYYWRVDGINGDEIYKGDIWRLKVMEFGGGAVIGDWELSLDGWLPWSGTTSYSNSVGVTLNSYSLKHVIPVGTGYVSVIELTDVSGGVDAFMANNTFSVDVTRLVSDWQGSGSSNIYMYVDAEGDGFHSYGISENSTWSPDQGNKTMTLTWNYADSLAVVAINPTFLRIIIWQEVSGFTGNVTYYFDNARLGTPLAASKPNPNSGQTDVKREPTLRWTAGKLALTHDVYFGTDENAVKNAAKTSPEYKTTLNLGSEKFQTGVLEFLSTYYWRIDEVDDENLFTGPVWSFTVGNYLSIDDFEDYNDYPPDEIWNTWIDGYSDATNGSTAGYPDPDFNAGQHYLETTIVHSGDQSLPLFYNNSVGISDVTKTLTSSLRNWTQEGVDTLRMWYYGDAANAAEPMYAALNGGAVVTNDDANAALVTEWTQWDIPLQRFDDMGVNLSTVNSISLGFGNKTSPRPGGGSGHVFFDDIRLTRP